MWWAPEKGDIPACVTLTKFPEKTVVRTKNLFHVKTCRVYWQASGDFLCVEVTRVSKSGKTEYTDFQLFRMQERNIPIEVRAVQPCRTSTPPLPPVTAPHPPSAVCHWLPAARSCPTPHKSTTSPGSRSGPGSASSTRVTAPAGTRPCSTTWAHLDRSTPCFVRYLACPWPRCSEAPIRVNATR